MRAPQDAARETAADEATRRIRPVEVLVRALAAWVYTTVEDSVRAERNLAALAAAEPITVDDARVVAWPADRPGPAKRGLYSVPIRAALDDILWGMLIGIAAYGRLAETPTAAIRPTDPLLEKIGFEQEFVTALRAALAPGTWTILVLGNDATLAHIGTLLTAAARYALHTTVPDRTIAIVPTWEES